MTDILPVSVLLSNSTLQGSLLRYITLSYLNWPRNGEPSKFKVWKKCSTYTDLHSKLNLFHAVLLDFKLQRLAIFMPVEVGESCIPQKKALLLIV